MPVESSLERIERSEGKGKLRNGIPEILLFITTQDTPVIIYKVCHIPKLLLSCLSIDDYFYDCSGNDTNAQTQCQGFVSVKVFSRSLTKLDELGIIRDPVCKMILGETSKRGSLSGGLADEVDCFCIVGFDL